jgi:hypothetical protein
LQSNSFGTVAVNYNYIVSVAKKKKEKRKRERTVVDGPGSQTQPAQFILG